MPGLSTQFWAFSAAVQRKKVSLVNVCIASFLVLWLARVQDVSLFQQPSTARPSGPASHNLVDLSHAASPFIGWPLARVCSETTWVPGLVFICDNNSGGIGNIRNYILTCVRYAIEAGATGLVVPRIRTRSASDLADIMRDYRPFNYFFDEGHFRKSLAESCPRIVVYDATEDIPHAPSPFRAERLTPNELGLRAGCDQRDLNRHADIFGFRFRSWLQDTARQFDLPLTSMQAPRVIRLNWGVQWDYPVYQDGPEFAATFGGILRFRSDILQLGEKIASHVKRLAVPGSREHGRLGFAGIHLRTESDALVRWPNFEEQSTAYLEKIARIGLKTAYLATGNSTEASKLAETALRDHGIRVVTKHSILEDHQLEIASITALTWDQQALVDFFVLLESNFFLGVSPSSFSMNVALKRHLKADGLYTRPWKVGGESDGYSWLVGHYDSYWEDWLFMFQSLWP